MKLFFQVERFNELFELLDREFGETLSSAFVDDEINAYSSSYNISLRNEKMLVVKKLGAEKNLNSGEHRRLSELTGVGSDQSTAELLIEIYLKNCIEVDSMDAAKQAKERGFHKAICGGICLLLDGPVVVSNENYFNGEPDRMVFHCINSELKELLWDLNSLDFKTEVT